MERQSRRAFLRSGGALVAGATAVAPVTAHNDAVFGGWLGRVTNFNGVVDKRGQKEVTVKVGVQANGGPYGFGPAAVRISRGATVQWQWTGKGGIHNVVHKGGTFKSQLYHKPGVHFEHTFDEEGVYKYFCGPHKPLGMKGAIVVGDALSGGGSVGGGSQLPIVGSFSPVSALVGGLVVGVLGGGVGMYLWSGGQTSSAPASTATPSPTTPLADTPRQPASHPDDERSASRGQQTAGATPQPGQSPPAQDAQPPNDQTANSADDTPSDASVTCPQCDATLSPATEYCPSCGQPLD